MISKFPDIFSVVFAFWDYIVELIGGMFFP